MQVDVVLVFTLRFNTAALGVIVIFLNMCEIFLFDHWEEIVSEYCIKTTDKEKNTSQFFNTVLPLFKHLNNCNLLKAFDHHL